MWEVPHAERLPNEDLPTAAVRIARELTGLEIEPGAEVITIRHGVTRFAITLVCLEADYRGGSFAPGFYAAAKWLWPRTHRLPGEFTAAEIDDGVGEDHTTEAAVLNQRSSYYFFSPSHGWSFAGSNSNGRL